MGLWGSIKNFFGFGSSSSSRSTRSYNYNYEPDKVKAAELERDTKLKLAEKEAERIELMRDVQPELIRAQTMSRTAIEKARVEGMTAMVNQLVVLQERMPDVAKKRIAIIEEGSLPIVREIEKFYDEVGEKISAHSDEYNTKKLPQLLKILGQYEKDSPAHEIFSAQIRADMERQGKFIEEQMARVSERQNLVCKVFCRRKKKFWSKRDKSRRASRKNFCRRGKRRCKLCRPRT